MSSPSLLEKCCLIGHPSVGNPTQYMIEQALRQAGADWRFLTFDVTPEDLGDAMRGIRALGMRGVKIVDPHRETVLEYVDEKTQQASLAGSANCITLEGERLTADNTLGKAFATLAGELAGKQVVMLGAGRNARTIATGAALAGAAKVTIIARSAETGSKLAELVQNDTEADAAWQAWSSQPLVVPPECDVLVNATSLGALDPDEPLPLEVHSLREGLLVCDLTFDPPGTWLLDQAEQRSATTIDGLSLFVEQTALALSRWSAIEADRTAMREAVEEFLAI